MSLDCYLPQELIDAVIGHLSGRCDLHTLASCALVSKSLSIPARKRLFSVIELGNSLVSFHAALRRLRVMAEFLTNHSSDLAYHIRELRVEVLADEILDVSSGLDCVLDCVAARCHNLSAFSFGGTWQHVVAWTTIRPYTMHLLTDLFSSIQITKLRLAYINELPTSIITNRSYIQSFEATNTAFTGSVVPMNAPTCIEHLDIFPNIAEFNKYIGSAISLGRRLDAYLGLPEDIAAFLEIAGSSPRVLSSITLLLDDYETCLDSFLAEAPHPLPVIPAKKVTFICGPVFFPALPALYSIVALLDHVVDARTLEVVSIRFFLATSEKYVETFVPRSDSGLQAFGRYIIQQRFPKLDCIIVELFISLQVSQGHRGVWSRDLELVEQTKICMESHLESELSSLFIPADYALSMDVSRLEAHVKTSVRITVSR